MILLADSGSTKTHWRLLDGSDVYKFETIGLNPHFISSKDLQSVLNNFKIYSLKVDKVFFYGAGCGSSDSIKWLKKQLQIYFLKASVYVESDLLGAARALFGKEPGLVGILGTGSNIGFYNGDKLFFKKPSLGYILGDEGSGNYLGQLFLSAYFRNELSDNISKNISLNRKEVLKRIYEKPYPNRYLASFAPFIFQHRTDSDIAIIIQKNFIDWIEKCVLPYDENKELSVVGSVAFYFNIELRSVVKKYGYCIKEIIDNPIDKLLLYYLK